MKITEKLKNIFIVILILLATYQTFTLWLVSIPINNSSAYSPLFFFGQKTVDFDNKPDYFTPSKIITNNNQKYYIQYSQLKNDNKLNFAKELILEIDSFDSEQFNYSSLNDNFIALNFEFDISTNLLEEIFSKNLKNVEDFNFNTILISLEEENNLISFSLVNPKTKQIYTATINCDESLKTTFNNEIAKNNNKLYHNLIIKDDNIEFVPIFDDDSLKYYNVNLTNPYLSDVGLLKNDLTEKIKPLFYGSKNKVASTVDNNIVVISDSYNVAKYYPNDVLEYSYYKTLNTSSKTTNYEDYITALEFISKDSNLKNEIYLVSYTVNDEKITFYFNYAVNNLPILLSPSDKNNLGINSALEISVSKGEVVHYKLLVYNYETAKETTSYSRDKFVNDVENTEYEELTLGYALEENNTLMLYWLLSSEDNTFMKSVK